MTSDFCCHCWRMAPNPTSGISLSESNYVSLCSNLIASCICRLEVSGACMRPTSQSPHLSSPAKRQRWPGRTWKDGFVFPGSGVRSESCLLLNFQGDLNRPGEAAWDSLPHWTHGAYYGSPSLGQHLPS